MKEAAWRKSARQDVADAAYWYACHGGLTLGEDFLIAVEEAVSHIAHCPASGSPRYADILKIAGLRFWAVERFPYLIFYIEHATQIDIWRVLHGERDIAARLGTD